jgi:hypothetical protein
MLGMEGGLGKVGVWVDSPSDGILIGIGYKGARYNWDGIIMWLLIYIYIL